MPDQSITGVLKILHRDTGVLCDPANSLRPFAPPIAVPARLIREHSLIQGVTLTGPLRRQGNAMELARVEEICGLTPQAFRRRTPYADLTAINPCERFELGVTGDVSMRILDLIAPIGKGTRGLIVSPPKAGKTILLERIAQSIRAGAPEARVIVLLIDERPEEVTQFQRAVDAEVFASSMDQSLQDHVELAELTLAHVRAELECGRDIVILVDSLTRMGRAFNSGGGGSEQASRDSRSQGGGQRAGACGQGRRDIARRGSGARGSGTPGSGTPGSGARGSGTPGSGARGSGTRGSGTPGSGTPGSGTRGSGTRGSGTPGSGTRGSGTRGAASRGGGSGRIMSGGLQAGVLEIPRRFFGLARNIENGGSVTIIATALVDTNSRMDEVIFQEFKGTGNSEIVLDRTLADMRIFPAINFAETGTRKEEILHGPDVYPKIALLRRALADLPGREVIPALIRQLEKHPTNREFLEALPG
jgi:transcription termination factor Rho